MNWVPAVLVCVEMHWPHGVWQHTLVIQTSVGKINGTPSTNSFRYFNKHTLELFSMICIVMLNLRIRLAPTIKSVINSTALISCTGMCIIGSCQSNINEFQPCWLVALRNSSLSVYCVTVSQVRDSGSLSFDAAKIYLRRVLMHCS